MPRVQSYRRRDGVRVRAHFRRNRARRSTIHRSTTRRSTTRRATVRYSRRSAPIGRYGTVGLLLLALPLALCAILTGISFAEHHPIWATTIALGIALAIAAATRAALLARTRRQAHEAMLARTIAATDTMTGDQFEHWVARVLTNSGFTDVRVCGRSGDRGADILAVTPDGRRAVVQCKRQGPGNPVGSAAIQRFAGTCRAIHRGDLCVIVTTGRFSAGDGLRLARELDIVLIDRSALACWAADATLPAQLCPQPPATA